MALKHVETALKQVERALKQFEKALKQVEMALKEAGLFMIAAAAKGIPQGRRVLEHEPHVAGPAGLATDAGGLFWANLKAFFISI